ncbi:MAG: hypothetical protein K2X27_10755 [Candidatus Obscuribacterales bacterium]|nr:hypothetical protein [Candidatus Obscuribacterales bacterium]
MKSKLKVLALCYGEKDKTTIEKWERKYSASLALLKYTDLLRLPIQAALAEVLQDDEFEAFIIDDHRIYDPIVLNQLSRLFRLSNKLLFSATNGFAPIIGVISNLEKKNNLLHLNLESEAITSRKEKHAV